MSLLATTALAPGIHALPRFEGADHHLWLVDLDAYSETQDWLQCSPVERQQASRLRGTGQATRYLAGRHALRCVLASGTGLSPAALHYRLNAFGKPELESAAGLHFNLGHSNGWALIGVRRAGPIGVDIERYSPLPDLEGLASSHLSTAEQSEWCALAGPARSTAFFRAWTRKEACLKALGTGLSIAPHLVDVGSGPRPRQPVIVWQGFDCGLQVRDIDLAPHLVAAVAYCDPETAARAQAHALAQ
jgi:4'-phosphopantetheinyl transferase